MSSDAAAGDDLQGCGGRGVWRCAGWIAAGDVGEMALNASCETGAGLRGDGWGCGRGGFLDVLGYRGATTLA